jgi:hypothetical protein
VVPVKILKKSKKGSRIFFEKGLTGTVKSLMKGAYKALFYRANLH